MISSAKNGVMMSSTMSTCTTTDVTTPMRFPSSLTGMPIGGR
jgi:hypothetical protein